jgi:hypothetical protein
LRGYVLPPLLVTSVWIRSVLRLAAASAAGLLLGSVFLAENALHVPNHSRTPLTQAESTARDTQATVEEVRVRAVDGAELKGWLFTPPRATAGE